MGGYFILKLRYKSYSYIPRNANDEVVFCLHQSRLTLMLIVLLVRRRIRGANDGQFEISFNFWKTFHIIFSYLHGKYLFLMIHHLYCVRH